MKKGFVILALLMLTLATVSGTGCSKQTCPRVVSASDADGCLFGYVDDEGKEITGCIYDKAEPFRNGRARVCRHGKWGYVDLGGKEVVQPVYDALGEFYPGNRGLAMVKSGECYGFIKRNGDVAIPIVYDYCDSRFEEGRVRVQLHGRWGFLDQFGCDVIPLLYDDAEAFYGGYAAVMQDGEWLLLDADGNRFSETDKNKRR